MSGGAFRLSWRLRHNTAKALFAVAGLLRGACHRARIRGTRWLASNDDQIPATDDHISDSLRLSEATRVNGAASSSSSGRRSPTILTLPPLMLRATRTIESSASVAPSFGA